MQARLAVRLENDFDGTSPMYLLHPGHQFLVGRGRHSDILIPDAEASRRHCRLWLSADGVLQVTDLGSANGTFLRGRRLAAQTPVDVNDGERIRIAQYEIEVSLEMALEDDHALFALPEEEFEVRGLIGKGGSGRVYAARQTIVDREVAVKALRVSLREDSERRQRFLSEARLCGRVRSPYVVRVYDLRVVRERLFLIMELVNGPSLDLRLEEGPPLTVSEVLRLAEHVALGLAAIHAEGVVHRDIKPANILLTAQGVAKLTDFGIAKDVHGTSGLTDTGIGLGTLPYVAPEQLLSAVEANTRSDLYALGATLFRVLAGRPPFEPTGPSDIMKMVDEEPPRLEALAPETPRQLAELVHHLLAKDPAQRPASAKDVVELVRGLRDRLVPAADELPDLGPTPRAIGVPKGFGADSDYTTEF